MDKTVFCRQLQEAVQSRLGELCRCEIREIAKNNVKRKALVIQAGQERVLPVIYLEPFYQSFQAGMGIDEAAGEILALYRSKQDQPDYYESCVPMVQDYDRVKGAIIMKVINAETNRDYLAHTPHIPVNGLDLAGIFFLVLSDNEEGMAGVTVTQGLLNNWGKTLEELFVTARKNMESSYPMEVKELEQVIKNLVSKEEWQCITEDLSAWERLPLYILTDARTGMVGASGFFMKEAIHDFAVEKGCNLIIFPSSIHELLLFPENENGIDKRDLYDMVRIVNQTSVTVEDFLSDHVYYYNRTTKEITYY